MQKSERRMQLWTDDTHSEYTILFEGNNVAQSSHKVKYTKLIDQSPYVNGYDNDWNYTLSQWVVYYLLNKYLILSRTREIVKQVEFNIKDDDGVDSRIPMVVSEHVEYKRKSKPIPKPDLRCHFCNLKYCLEEERKEHEVFWHSNKLMK
jgi:hypothetical protein